MKVAGLKPKINRQIMKKIIKNFFIQILNKIIAKRERADILEVKSKIGKCGNNVVLHYPLDIVNPQNVFLHDNTHIYGGSKIITLSAKYIMKKNSGAAQGFTVVTGNHTSTVGVWFKDLINKEDVEKDVIVEEDVWISTNVTLLAGVTIGRGSIIGAGAVCRKNIPPYAIAIGNPAKVIGFRFNPIDTFQHECILYSEDERLPMSLLEKNYNKYFMNKLSEIQDFIK